MNQILSKRKVEIKIINKIKFNDKDFSINPRKLFDVIKYNFTKKMLINEINSLKNFSKIMKSRLNFFITGAAGFIGSHVCESLVELYKDSKFILFDKLTYAANRKYLSKIIKKKMLFFLKVICLILKIYKKN